MAENTETNGAGDPIAGLGASVEDIEAALGLPPEAEEKAAATKKDAPAGADKGEKKDAKADGEPAPEKSEEEKAIEEWNAVRARALARRREKQAAARGEVAEPGDDPAPAAAAPAKDPEKKAPTAAESSVKTLVADVIAALGELDAEDEAPAADTDKARLAATAKREAALAEVKEKLSKIGDVLEDSVAAKAKYAELEKKLNERVAEIEDTAFVYGHAEHVLSKHEATLPHLSRQRNAAQILVREAANFLERKRKAAPMAFIAERVERVLARRAGDGAEAPEKNGKPNGAPEKQHPSRKTTSSTLATPPSRRATEDKRSPKEVEEDLWKSLGIDQTA